MTYDELNIYLLILTARASAANNYQPPSADFTNMLPMAINYGEDRCYRDLVMLATRTQDSSLTCSGDTRSLDLTQMTTQVIVPEGLSLITPVGAIPALGTQLPFFNAELSVIDVCWPTESDVVDPSDVEATERRWAMKDAQTIVVSPTPDASYPVLITGLFRPTAISSTNQSTYLSTTYAGMFLSACMIFMTGYLRNYGAQADQPKMGVSWETQYELQKEQCILEEQRRRGRGIGWSQNQPPVIAKPPGQ